MTPLGQSFPGNEPMEPATRIPADVMREAMRIKNECNVDFGGGIGGGAIIRMIANAILAERERCADIATQTWPNSGPMDVGHGARIADAIRKGGPA